MSKTQLAGLGCGLLAACLCAAAPAAAEDEIPNTAAWRSNTGLVAGVGFAVLVPDEGSLGFGAELNARYGMPVGPIILAPGGLLGGYFLQERFIADLLGTLRLTAPLGPLAPFVQGGAGPGVLTSPGDAGVAWLAGGGLVVHFGGVLTIGVEVNYQGITGTGYKSLSIGPSISIGG
jgi:hypothetical protein